MSTPPLHPNEPEPRLPTLSSARMRPEWLATLGRIPGEGLKGAGFPHHVLGQLMHSPDLLGPFLEWWVSAKSAMALSVREQELVILRMACLYASDYVWKHHVPVALEFAISAEEIQALRQGRFTGFAPRERSLLVLAEAMVEQRGVARELWECHGRLLAPQEVVDLIALVAQYVLFALTNNVLQVQVEAALQGVPGLGED
jgi:4-carboxymuconolactone decarboxylase